MDCQKFYFNEDGKLLAVGSEDGRRIFLLELIMDSVKSLHEVILIGICYRGWFSSHLKEMRFSPDDNFLIVTSDTGKIHIYDIKEHVAGKNNLKTVRKYQIERTMTLRINEILTACNLSKPMTRQLASMKLCKADIGNQSVPGVTFVSAGLAIEGKTQREQYIIQVTSRWGLAFEIALYNNKQMVKSMADGDEAVLERAFAQKFVPDSWELINVYKLYDHSLDVEVGVSDSQSVLES